MSEGGPNPPSDNLYISDLPAGFKDDDLRRIFGAYGVITQGKCLQAPSPDAKVSALLRFSTPTEAKWLVENLHGNIPQGLTEPIFVKYAESPEQRAQRRDGFGKGARPSPYGAGGLGSGMLGFGKGAKGFGKWDGGWGVGGGGKGNFGKSGHASRALFQTLLNANAFPAPSDSAEGHALFVSGLPHDTQDIDLFRIFAPFGALTTKGVRALLNVDGSCKGVGYVNFMDLQAAQNAMSILHGTQLPDGGTLSVKDSQPPAKRVPGQADDPAQQMLLMAGQAGMA